MRFARADVPWARAVAGCRARRGLWNVPPPGPSARGTVPIGRGGTVDEVAEAALWLLSDRASYVTATLFNVSGGR